MEKPEWFDWANDERKTGEWIRVNNPEWFAQVCQILFDYDPMMMTLVGEPEGYAPEVGSILRSLPQCMNVDDVQQLIFNVFTQWFTPEPPSCSSHTPCLLASFFNQHLCSPP